MRRRLPDGAQEIWDLRMKGKKPGDLIFISTVGWLNVDNPQIFVDYDQKPESYEWRWVRGLQVVLAHDSLLSGTPLLEYIREIARHLPNTMGYSGLVDRHGSICTWNVDAQGGQECDWYGEIKINIEGFDDIPEDLTCRRLSIFEQRAWEGIDRA